jgi:hypothetical protein
MLAIENGIKKYEFRLNDNGLYHIIFFEDALSAESAKKIERGVHCEKKICTDVACLVQKNPADFCFGGVLPDVPLFFLTCR